MSTTQVTFLQYPYVRNMSVTKVRAFSGATETVNELPHRYDPGQSHLGHNDIFQVHMQ